MKNSMMLLISGLIGVLTLLVVMTICGRWNRSVELQENLSTAMESTIQEMLADGHAWSDEEILAQCMERLAISVDSDMALKLEVYEVDAKKGILSLRAVGKYKHPNGMEAETAWERTVLVEQGGMEEVKSCEVSFYLDKMALEEGEACYKRYEIMEGEHLTAPAEPKKDGKRFACWKDGNDYVADFSQLVYQDLCYYATWE